jgi:glycosyltransferase involved in cell wall biosynthesis
VGYGELEGDIAARITGSALLSRYVSVEGYRCAGEMPGVLGGALALLLPSIEEQFGIVVTEALSCGIPVILTPACGATVLVRDFVNGFVIDAANAEGWIEALELRRLRVADNGITSPSRFATIDGHSATQST